MKRIVFAVALFLAGPTWADDPATMVITGVGEVAVAPDMATISLGVITHDDVAADALRGNSQQLERVFAVLQEAGIADSDMQTTRFDVQPTWRNRSSGSSAPAEIDGYTVTNTLLVLVRDIDTLGQVLDAVARAGANEFRGISFGLQNPGPVTDEARIAAVADAQARAALYAQAAGFEILGILSFSESGGGMPHPEMMTMAARNSVPVAQGEVGITASVNITYEISQ